MNTSRIPFISRRPTEPFGLFALQESKRVVLPLKGVECDFSVLSGLAEVSMTQIFRQDNDRALDCEYLFPLPADASVYACEADINGRIIRAQVRERQEARQIAAAKKAAGFRTALVEAERENLFTLSLGNVQPGDLVILRLKYFQTLRSLAGMPSIEVPFCPGVRYIPGAPLLRSNKGKGVVDDTDQVPDASRITPVRIDAEHPDAAYIEVRGTLDGRFVKEKDLCSPSHAIVVQRSGAQVRITLSDKGEVPDRDFVLRWSERQVEQLASRAWVQARGPETYALLEIRAPQAALAERAPVDFYFLVDRSGSMRGEKWTKAVQALQSCVRVLGPADRAMVTFFETSCRDFAEQPLSAQELLNDQQFQSVQRLGTGGGTNLGPALKHVLEVAARHSVQRRKNLLLITDAQIGNESAILELMKSAPDMPVHCFGIDVALNDALLLALCRQQGGTFHSLNPQDDIEQVVTALGKTLGQPVLLDLELAQGWEAAQARIPNLYAGQIHYLSARGTSDQALRLRARTAAGEAVNFEFEPQPAALEAPYLHWCRSRIQRLVAEGKNREAVTLSVQSNLICPVTAFLAWDESERVAVASHQLVQPVQEVYESVRGFSAPAPGARGFEDGMMPRQANFVRQRARPPQLTDDELLQRLNAKGMHLDPDLELKQHLRWICLQAQLPDWEPLMIAILRWIAEAGESEQPSRMRALRRLVEELEPQARLYDQFVREGRDAERNEVRERIQRMLKEFVNNLSSVK